jgi:hypothetical protein
MCYQPEPDENTHTNEVDCSVTTQTLTLLENNMRNM